MLNQQLSATPVEFTNMRRYYFQTFVRELPVGIDNRPAPVTDDYMQQLRWHYTPRLEQWEREDGVGTHSSGGNGRTWKVRFTYTSPCGSQRWFLDLPLYDQGPVADFFEVIHEASAYLNKFVLSLIRSDGTVVQIFSFSDKRARGRYHLPDTLRVSPLPLALVITPMLPVAPVVETPPDVHAAVDMLHTLALHEVTAGEEAMEGATPALLGGDRALGGGSEI